MPMDSRYGSMSMENKRALSFMVNFIHAGCRNPFVFT